MRKILFVLLIILVSNCQSTNVYTIDDVGEIQRFSVKNRGRSLFDHPIKVSVEGKTDGGGYIYLTGAEQGILPPNQANFEVKIHKGRNKKTRDWSVTLPSNYALNFVYVPIDAKEGDLTVIVEW
ncbi:hypothetical protein [Larkinella rosea]|uniref:Uncharacterized protein n=1 Tax=Larkinella rosea TaxID=2025312 RepID=A0A3P1BJD0_9BACT|nr:hypothetical protein [Larkinella rosea]RRB01115.1 hypothetical protein EHT25_23360 [Larkinella rosea]